jgi:LPXTG-motif cell wall-anchored protein
VSTNLIIGIAVMVSGLVLLFMGYNASQAPLEQASEALTGRFSQQTTWFLLAGGAAVVVGAVLIFLARRR